MVAALLALALLLAACSDNASTVDTPERSTTDTVGTTDLTAPTTTEKVSTTVAERSSSCEAVSSEMLAAIATGLKPETKASLARGFAVKSTEHSKAWYIAAELDGPGLEGSGDIGIGDRTASLPAAESSCRLTGWPSSSATGLTRPRLTQRCDPPTRALPQPRNASEAAGLDGA